MKNLRAKKAFLIVFPRHGYSFNNPKKLSIAWIQGGLDRALVHIIILAFLVYIGTLLTVLKNTYWKHIWNSVLIVMGLGFFFYISLGERLWHLNNTQLDQSGDGLKNYYTFAYQYKYLDGFHFSGLLYPYGDLTLYADSQIGLVWILQFMKFFGIDASNYLLGILNISTISSFFIAAIIVYFILKHYHISQKYIVLTSIFCIALTPQLWRIQSHYALSYAFIFPLIWLIILKIRQAISDKKRLVYSGFLILFLLFFSFIHAYHLVVNVVFILAFGILYLFSDRRFSLYLFSIATIPIVSFLVINRIIDPVQDRPANPYGMWAYNTDFVDLFPFYGYVNDLLSGMLELRSEFTEGYCYVSFLPFFILIFSIIAPFISRKKLFHFYSSLPQSLKYSFYASLICLSVATGIHLMLTEGFILEIIPKLKQFRGLGRFSWPFYYIIFIFSSIITWKLLDLSEHKIIRTIIPFFIVVIWFDESYSYHQAFRKNINLYSSSNILKNEHTISGILDTSRYGNIAFQAILTLPPSTEGGEKVNLNNDYHIKTRVLPYSYQSGIPLTTSIMSRVPISTTLNILKLSSSSYSKKNLKDKYLINEKPFLVVIHRDYIQYFDDLLRKSTFVGSSKFLDIYFIESKDLIERDCYPISPESIDLSNITYYESRDTLLLFKDFENINLGGIGDKKGTFFCKTGNCDVLNLRLMDNTEKEIMLSFWQKLTKDKSSVPTFRFVVYDEKDKEYQADNFRDWDMPRMEVYEDWIRFDRTYMLDSLAKRINLSVYGDHIHLDNVLVKSNNIDVHYDLDNNEAYANHLMILRCN